MGRYVLFVMVLMACEKKVPRYEGPLRVELGDCADAAVWVSGPRPLPIEERVVFADRTDIEIAGELVTCGDIVRTIDVAIKVGFTDFSFTSPTTLAARPTL